MPIMYRCPGELRHTTRGFLYDQREFADAAQARADGWADTLEEAAGLGAAPILEPVESDEEAERQDAQRSKDEQAGKVFPTRLAMIAALEAAGVDVDGRWGNKRIAAEFAALEQRMAAKG